MLSLGEGSEEKVPPITLLQLISMQVHKWARYFVVCAYSCPPYLETRAGVMLPLLFAKETAQWCKLLNCLNKGWIMRLISSGVKLGIFTTSFPNQCKHHWCTEKKMNFTKSAMLLLGHYFSQK